MQSIPLQTSGSWVVPTRPVVTNDEGYIINAVGTQYDWDFRGSAKMPRGDPTLEHYFSVSQVNGVPTYLDAEEGALAWDYAGQNLYVFNGTAWVLVSSGGGLQNLAQTLAIGNVTGANDIVINSPQSINYVGGLQIGSDNFPATAAVGSLAIGGSSSAVATALAIGRTAQATNTNSFSIGNASSALGVNSLALGNFATAGSANQNLVIGNQAGISGDTPGTSNLSILIGNNSTLLSGATRTIAIGSDLFTVGDDITLVGAQTTAREQCTVIGALASCTGIQSCAIGGAANTAVSYCTAIGYSATTGAGAGGGLYSTSVGWGASCPDLEAVAVGASSASLGLSVAIGYSSEARAGGTAIGYQTFSLQNGVAVGTGAETTGLGGICIGQNSRAGTETVALGVSAIGAAPDSVCIGSNSLISADASTCIVVGNGVLAGTQALCSILGYNNSIGFSLQQLSVLGYNNTVATGCSFNTVIGSGNSVTQSSLNFIGGDDNAISNQTLGVVIGKSNAANSIYNVVIGWENIDNGDSAIGKSVLIGATNEARVENSTNPKVMIGNGNVAYRGGVYIGSANNGGNPVTSSNEMVMIGTTNLSDCDNSILIGGSNTASVTNTSSNYAINIGFLNDMDSQFLLESMCIGWNNTMISSTTQAENYVIGNNNTVSVGTTNVVCIGHDITATDDDCWYFSPDLPSYSTITQLGYNPTDGRVSWTIPNPSSRRWKENIEPFNEAERVLDLELVEFNWKKGHCRCIGGCDEEPCRAREIGMIAEDVAEILPQIVNFHRDGNPCDKSVPKIPQGLDYGRIGALLVPLVRAQRDQIKVMKKQLDEVTDKVSALQSESKAAVPDVSVLVAALEAQKRDIDTLSREVFQLRSKVFS